MLCRQFAPMKGHAAAVEALLVAGADLDVRDENLPTVSIRRGAGRGSYMIRCSLLAQGPRFRKRCGMRP